MELPSLAEPTSFLERTEGSTTRELRSLGGNATRELRSLVKTFFTKPLKQTPLYTITKNEY